LKAERHEYSSIKFADAADEIVRFRREPCGCLATTLSNPPLTLGSHRIAAVLTKTRLADSRSSPVSSNLKKLKLITKEMKRSANILTAECAARVE